MRMTLLDYFISNKYAKLIYVYFVLSEVRVLVKKEKMQIKMGTHGDPKWVMSPHDQESKKGPPPLDRAFLGNRFF